MALAAGGLPGGRAVVIDIGQSATSSSSTAARIAAVAAGNSTAATAVERARRLRAGRATGRAGYPRPGDSVRQHARKAAKRRNQVRARRAARG